MTLVGKAVADAWGVPFELMAPDADKLQRWDGGPPTAGSPFHGCGPGQYSDDTQMALCLARSLVAGGGYRQELAADQYLAWYKSGEARGMGNAVRAAMENLDAGASFEECGIHGAKGSGTAMRALPLGLWYWRDTMKLKEVCEADALLTHVRAEAVDGSYVIAALAAYTIASSQARKTAVPRVTPSLVRILAKQLPRKSTLEAALNMAAALGESEELLTGGAPGKLNALIALSAGLEDGVVEAVGTAVAAILLGEDYRQVVELSIRTGGDTDTRAAMAGGVTSLWSPVPADMKRYVQELDELATLDRALLPPAKV